MKVFAKKLFVKTDWNESAFMSLINSIKYYTDYKVYSEGEIIFKEGDPGDVMYAVVEGEVDIIVHNKPVSLVRQGEVIGEMALIDRKPRSATAIARTDCKLVVINEQRFNFLLKQTPMFVTQIMRVMAERLRNRNNEEE